MIRRLALLVACLLVAGCQSASPSTRSSSGGSATPLPTVTAGRVVIDQDTGSPPHSSTSAVVARVLPSVVNIKVAAVSTGAFGNLLRQKAQGSGVVVSKDGVILTNNHVVADAIEVRVAFNNGDILRGSVIGTDPVHDVAVVKVDATDLKTVSVGNSNKLELGDKVIALGFPLDLGGPTVTEGIVSGLDRSVNIAGENGDREHLKDLIQTDAAINPGNSGGALVDAAGRLVGINTAAASAGLAENVGFSIAIDKALPIVRHIISHPITQGAFMGVTVADLDNNKVARAFHVPPGTPGAGVASVLPGGPAEKAGLKPRDIITAIDQREVDSPDALTEALSHYLPGDRIRVTYERDGTTHTTSLTLVPRPAGLESSASPSP